MESHQEIEEPHSMPPNLGDTTEAFNPHLTLSAKVYADRKRGINFRRLFIGAIDFAGDQTPDLNGIRVRARGGLLLPAADFPPGMTAVKDGNNVYLIQGSANDGLPYAPFDLAPDGFSQAGCVTIEKEGLEPIEAQYEFNPAPLNWLFDVVESLVWAFFIAMLIRLIIFQTFYIPSGSMEPTLFEGDRIVANKLIYKLRPPTSGEVIIFKVYTYLNGQEMGENTPRKFMPMGNSSFTKDPKLGDRFTLRDYIKRVGAVAGDKIEIKDRKLFVNDKLVDEPWITDPKYDFNYNFGPEIVPEGCLFVLGDNHQNSQDSHKLGFLPVENVVGKAMFVFYPPKSIKIIH